MSIVVVMSVSIVVNALIHSLQLLRQRPVSTPAIKILTIPLESAAYLAKEKLDPVSELYSDLFTITFRFVELLSSITKMISDPIPAM